MRLRLADSVELFLGFFTQFEKFSQLKRSHLFWFKVFDAQDAHRQTAAAFAQRLSDIEPNPLFGDEGLSTNLSSLRVSSTIKM